MTAFFKAVTTMMLWNEHLTLLPLFVGMGLYRLNYAYSRAAQVLGGIALLVVFYVGLTAVGATLDAYDIFDREFAYALVVAAGQVFVGLASAYWLFGRYIHFEEEFLNPYRFSERLDPTAPHA